MFAIRRLKSQNPEDIHIGIDNITYMILFLIPIGIGYYLYDYVFETCGKEIANMGFLCLAWISITFSYGFYITKDYKNINNIHKGTLQYYIYDINMPNKLSLSPKEIEFIEGVASALSIFSLVGILVILNLDSFVVGGFEKFVYFTLLFMWLIFNIKIASGYIQNKIKNIKVSEEKIKGFFDIEEIDNDEKQAFLRYMKNLIKAENIVTKENLYDWCIKTQNVLNDRKRYQETTAINTENSEKRHEYQDILDYRDLKN